MTKKIGLYFSLLFVFSAPFYYMIMSEGTMKGNALLVLGSMFDPAFAAMLTELIVQKNLKRLCWKLSTLNSTLCAI